jgi:hypothetical protein
MITLRTLIALFLTLLVGPVRAAEPAAPLVLERTIPLPSVAGRIDHLSVDLDRNRLLVAELGNGSVDLVDLGVGKAIDRISGLKEPQGVAYVPASDRIVVANGGDGAVRMFRAGDLSPAGEVALGDDADNIRVDPRSGHVVVGYGSGGLAVIDPVGPSKLADIKLAAHPEAFQLESQTQRVFVNLPNAQQIGVVDLPAGRQIATWTVPGLRSNFPMAIDQTGSQLAIVFRNPAKLVLLDTNTGTVSESLATCNDADDAFFDAKRNRIYISCGEGAVDVFQRGPAATRLLAHIGTSPGGRTSLFVTKHDRLYVAVRARLFGSNASILVFRPTP